MNDAPSCSSITDRIAALREVMSAKAVDACIVPTGDPHMSEYISDHYKTREYITGFTGSAGTAVITAVLRGHINLARAKFLKGLSGENLDCLAHEPLWQMGLDYRHGTGHGVGHYLNVHEGPNRKHPFEEGMLSSDEPGYYEDGEFGIRHESLLLCRCGEETEYGQFMEFENVTMVPIDLDGIAPEHLQQDEIEYLNRYHENVYNNIAPLLNEEERKWLKQATREIK